MAERALATAFVNIVPGTKAMEQYLKGGIGASATAAGGNASAGFAKGFGGKMKGLIGPAFAAAAAIGATAFVSSALKSAEAAIVADKRLNQIAKSMNIFGSETGAVVGRLQEYASTQSRLLGVDDESIKSTQAKLLTFKELALTAGEVGGSFDRATMAAYDLAAAGFGTAESNAVQLGKALQDPIKGLTALNRSGVTFTAAERERITTLVESNKVGEAQTLVLQAIEAQVGGTAKATATGSARMKVAFDELKESVGMALAPAFEKFATALVPIVDKLAPIMVSLFSQLEPIFGMFIDVLDQLMPAMQPLVDVMGLLIEVGIEIIQAILPPLIDLFIGLMPLISELGELFAVIVRAILPPLVKLLNDVLIPIILWLADILVTYFVPYWTKLAEVMGGILTVAVEIVTKVFKGLMKILEPVWNAVKPLIEGFMSLMGLKPVKLSVGVKATGASVLDNYTGGKSGSKGIDFSKFTGSSTAGTGSKAGGVDAKSVAANSKAIKAALAKAGKAVKKAYTKYNEEIASAQADYAKATAKIDKQYNETVANLTVTRDTDLAKALTDHNANVLAIQKDFAGKMADIVQESKNRLRSAFESVTAVDVGSVFAELATKNADGLISSLKEKLTRARELVANAGKLASAGFSQTFIEQVVSQGPDAGNAMAKAILESSPDAQAEVQKLFGETEQLAGHGMDALADQIYTKSGLANEALRDMYAQAQKDLTDALAVEADSYALRQTEIQKTFDEGMLAAKVTRDEAMLEAQVALNEALAEATKNLNESLKAVEDELNASLKEFKGQLKGHAGEIKKIKDEISLARAEAVKPITVTRIENVVVKTSYQSTGRVKLAEGGLVTRPTNALIGEAGPELVMPLDEFAKLSGREGNGATVNYYAAPNQSLNAEQALFQAMKRAKVVAAW